MRRLIIGLTLLLFAASCGSRDRVDETFLAMGGIPVKLSGFDISASRFEEAVTAVKERTEALENLLSSHRPESELAHINLKGSGSAAEPTIKVVSLALELCKTTDGAFDPTVGPLIDLWRRAGAANRMPTDEELEGARSRIGCRRVRVSKSQSTISLGETGMRLDLGGIAKGYIAQDAVELMKHFGLSRGIVDAGGDVVLFSSKGDKPFRVGVRHPLREGSLFGVLSVSNGAVVTSGCYERTVEIQGERFCHIIDPRTGRPVKGPLSVTVVAREAAAADAYATALFVLGAEDGLNLARSLPEVEALFLLDDGKGGLTLKTTPGLMDRLEIID